MRTTLRILATLTLTLLLGLAAQAQTNLQGPTQQVVAFSATPAFNAASANIFVIVLTGNVTSSTLVNLTTGQQVIFVIQQDATGSRTFVWPTNVTAPPVINSPASASTRFSCVFDGSNCVAAYAGLQFSSGSITPAATAGVIQVSAQTFTVTGLLSGDNISLISGPAPTALCPFSQVRASAANTLQIWWTTLTAVACTPAAGTYIVQVNR